MIPNDGDLLRVAQWARSLMVIAVVFLLPPAAAGRQPEKFAPPEGYHLVAEDNCGTGSQTHVVVGTPYLYPPVLAEAPDDHRTIVFDNHACVLRYGRDTADGHYEVKLSQSEWRVLCAWIDCNVPYLDDYRKFSVDPKIRAED